MASFEFLFTLFALMLGLALTEVVGGIAKGVKRRGPARLGVLTPLLSAFLAYEITDFWLFAWGLRELVPIGTPALIGSLVVTGLYYFAAVLAWPDDGDAGWDDLDGWTLEHKRPILLSVFATGLLASGANFLLNPAPILAVGVVGLVSMGVYFALILVGALAPGRRMTIATVALLLLMHLTALVMHLIG
ncbi:hypothetical protein ACFOMD_16095 [Sphingoaurantiacus capsulatus]|uniref:Uncharacterized protein n=1 Tax=Sphingoaurantiacus capsulatus TaxID=1771310 RepID=A0ABV7XEC6_9SPHN